MTNSRAQFAYRLAFVLLCFLPTVGVGGWIFARSRPGFVLSDKQEWERELSRRLGLRVTIDAVDYPRHDTAELTGLAVADPETAEPLANIARLEVIRAADHWKLLGRQVELENKHLPQLKRCLEEKLLRLPAGDFAKCEFTFHDFTLRDGPQSQTLVDVAGGWQATRRGPLAQLQFRLPEAVAQSRSAFVVVERNRETSPPATRWQVDTGDAPVPCSLAAAVVPLVRQLGNASQFTGQIDVVQTGEMLRGQLRGTFDNLDLDTLVSEQFPHQLSGLATCQLEEAEFDEARVLALRGTVKASNGLVSRSLLEAASEQMQLVAPLLTQTPEGNAPLSFRYLSLGFDLRDTGLQLSGSADPTRTNVLISCAAGPLLEAPPQHRVSPLALARALVPAQEWQVPATTATRSLASFLPTPDLQPAATATRQGHVPMRLAPARDTGVRVLRQPNSERR